MHLYDHDHQENAISIHGPDELIAHLQSARKGPYGAFILGHDEAGPSLFVHINNDLAYLHFFPDNKGDHPGFQPTGMSPRDCPESVHFIQAHGSEADGYTMPWYTLVSVAMAYKAATEFLQEPVLPASIRWLDL